MDIQDMRGRYTIPTDNTLVKTFDGVLHETQYGTVHCVIYRAVRNDNGIAREATIRKLKKSEPNVGFWDGDVIQYYDMHGELIGDMN